VITAFDAEAGANDGVGKGDWVSVGVVSVVRHGVPSVQGVFPGGIVVISAAVRHTGGARTIARTRAAACP